MSSHARGSTPRKLSRRCSQRRKFCSHAKSRSTLHRRRYRRKARRCCVLAPFALNPAASRQERSPREGDRFDDASQKAWSGASCPTCRIRHLRRGAVYIILPGSASGLIKDSMASSCCSTVTPALRNEIMSSKLSPAFSLLAARLCGCADRQILSPRRDSCYQTLPLKSQGTAARSDTIVPV
jgi:hypothetical protein